MGNSISTGWRILPFRHTDVSPNLSQNLSALDLKHYKHQNGATEDEIERFIAWHLPTTIHTSLTMPICQSKLPTINFWLNWKIQNTDLPDVALIVSYRQELQALKKIINSHSGQNVWSEAFERIKQDAKEKKLTYKEYIQVDFNVLYAPKDLPTAMRSKALERLVWMHCLASYNCGDFPPSNSKKFDVILNPSGNRILGIYVSPMVVTKYMGDYAFADEDCVARWYQGNKSILLCHYEKMNDKQARALDCINEWTRFQEQKQKHMKEVAEFRKTQQSRMRKSTEQQIDEAFDL